MVAPLDDLQEKSRTILDRLGEDLKEVALVVVVDENLLPLQDVDILLHLDVHVGESTPQVVVICIGDLVEELDATRFHASHRLDDVLRAHCDVLHARTTVVLAELLDLTLPHALGWLVDGHLDLLIEVRHDRGAQRRVVRMNHLVVYRPEAMEVEHALIPLSDRLHLTVLLVAHAVVDVEKLGNGHEAVQGLLQMVLLVAGKEGAIVVHALYEGVDCVTIGLYAGDDDRAVLVGESLGLTHAFGASGHCLVVDAGGVIDGEGDVFHAIAVLGVVRRELFMVGVEGRREREAKLVVLHDVCAELTLACLQSLFFKLEIRFCNQKSGKADPASLGMVLKSCLTW